MPSSPAAARRALVACTAAALDVQPQHPAGRPGQTAQKFRVVAVAAGGIQVKAPRGQVGGQKFVAELHRRKVGHPPAHQPVPGGDKTELGGQGPGGLVTGQRGGEAGFPFGVQAALPAQHLLDQVAAVAAAPPDGVNLHPEGVALQPGGANGRVFLVQRKQIVPATDLHVAKHPFFQKDTSRPGGCQVVAKMIKCVKRPSENGQMGRVFTYFSPTSETYFTIDDYTHNQRRQKDPLSKESGKEGPV